MEMIYFYKSVTYNNNWYACQKSNKEPHNPITDNVAADSQGFLGGPQDTSVLMSYANHVIAKVWA